MKIVIPGGSGQVGTILARSFHYSGHHVIVLSRKAEKAPWSVIPWNGCTLGDWTREIDGCDVVINLAGRSVNCRYTHQNRQEILQSRLNSTRVIGQSILHARHPPRLWLQASTATIYAHRYDAPNDEFTGILGGSEYNAPESWQFSIKVAKAWELELEKFGRFPRTRTILMRSAFILGPDPGGTFDLLSRLVRLGIGGPSGDGNQFISWIHELDFIRSIYWLIHEEDIDGIVNIASPEPLTNAEFMRVLREAWKVPVGLPMPEWMIEAGAPLIQSEPELMLKSRRVIPGRLLQDGFTFKFPHWPEAARELCSRLPIAASGQKSPEVILTTSYV